MASTKIILKVSNDGQLDEQLDELCSGLIATEKGLREFCMVVQKVTQIIRAPDYPLMREWPEAGIRSLIEAGIGSVIYEGYRLGMARMAKLLLAEGREGLDLSIIRKEKT